MTRYPNALRPLVLLSCLLNQACSSQDDEPERAGERTADHKQRLSEVDFTTVKPLVTQGHYITSVGEVATSLDEVQLRAPEFDGPVSVKKDDGVDALAVIEEMQGSVGKNRLRVLLDQASEDNELDVVISFKDAPFAWERMQGLTEELRDQALEIRRGQVDKHVAPLRTKVESLGGKNISTFLVTPILGATLSAKAIKSLIEDELIEDITPRNLKIGTELAYTGHEARAGMRLGNFESNGYKGNANGRAGGAVRVGVIDELSLNGSHPGFRRNQTCVTQGTPPFTYPSCTWGSAFAKTWNCTSPSSACTAWTPDGQASHGTAMAGVLNGTIEGGQDWTYTSTLDRRQRSGIIAEGKASLYFYGISGTETASDGLSFAKVADRAVADQIDTLDLSMNYSGFPGTWGWCVNPCSRSGDCNGMNQALRNMTQQGTLVVKSAGNGGTGGIGTPSQECRITYPAWRPETLTVGGLKTDSTSTAYDSSTMYQEGTIGSDGSALGGVTIRTQGTDRANALSGVDLTAPAYWANLYGSGSSYNAATSMGTSPAAAAVAGAAALLRQASYDSGYTSGGGWSGYKLLTNMLLMGDSYSAFDNTQASGQRPCLVTGTWGASRPCGFDRWSGAGRVHMHYPSTADLDGPPAGYEWGWGSVSGSLSHSQTIGWFATSFTPPPSVTQVKIAMMFEEQDLTNSADLDLEVYDGCTGPTYGQLLNSDHSYDNRSRLVMNPADYSIPLNCWTIRVRAYHIPSGTRNYYLSWYWHTQNPAIH
jgi:hypothetical protein